METQRTQSQAPYPAQPVPARSYASHSDSQMIMGLGVVLLCFGGAITHQHVVTVIGLAMIVFSGWVD